MTDATDATDAATGQVRASAAEIYEEFFVPALFGHWPDRVLDVAGYHGGERLLDVGCGTGVLARTAARRSGGRGAVIGIDVNEGMLAVAGRAGEPITWRTGAAEDLPFADEAFDRVVSQFALMFFTDREAALREMGRVVRRGGTVTVATWADLVHSPGYDAMVDLLDRLFGRDAAEALRAPFTLGDPATVAGLLERHLADVSADRHDGTARFESIEAWVHTDIRGWTLADLIDDDQFAALLAAARSELARFTDGDGRVTFPAPAVIARGTRP